MSNGKTSKEHKNWANNVNIGQLLNINIFIATPLEGNMCLERGLEAFLHMFKNAVNMKKLGNDQIYNQENGFFI